MRLAVVALALLVGACERSSAISAPIPEQWRAVIVETTPLTLGVDVVGRLAFRGGVQIDSDDEVWGGLSGMEALENNRLLIINDDTEWFAATLVLDERGWLTGVVDVRYALMRDERGNPFPASGDSEGLAQLPDGRFAVSFEGTQTIRLYDINRDGPFGAAHAGPRLAGTERLPSNAGLEALAATEDGALLVGAEGGDRATTPLWRVALDGQTPTQPLIGYPTRDGYSLTGLDRLPNGDFVAVERFYAPIIGARARITRFPASALDAGGDLLGDVETLSTLAPPMPVDNFEAIAATLMPDGATRIYILSDDNYSPRQRTMLYAFDIIEAEAD